MPPSSIFVPAILATLLVASAARAESPQATAADALFRSAKESEAHGNLATACAQFAESQRLDPAVGTLLNLADCEEKSVHLAAALDHYRSARDQMAKDDFRIPFADAQIARLAPRVTELSPGPAPPTERVAAPLPRDADAADGTRRTAGFVAGAVGALGVGIGLVTGLMTIFAADIYKDHCRGGYCDGPGLDAASTGRATSVVSPVALGVGVVGLGVGAYLLLWAPKAAHGRVAVSPLVGPRETGVSVRF